MSYPAIRSPEGYKTVLPLRPACLPWDWVSSTARVLLAAWLITMPGQEELPLLLGTRKLSSSCWIWLQTVALGRSVLGSLRNMRISNTRMSSKTIKNCFWSFRRVVAGFSERSVICILHRMTDECLKIRAGNPACTSFPSADPHWATSALAGRTEPSGGGGGVRVCAQQLPAGCPEAMITDKNNRKRSFQI